MELNEAQEILNSRGFITEATVKPGDCLKYVKDLNGWNIKQQNPFMTTDNLYAVKVIDGVRVGVDIYIYLKKDMENDIKLFMDVFKFGDSMSSNIKLKRIKYIKSVAKELKRALSSYLDKVEEIITYIVTNKIRVPKGSLDSILDFKSFKELYDSKKKPEYKKIYAVCKRYASTTSSVDYVDAYHYSDYYDKDKNGKRIDLGCKGYYFEIRRAQKDGLSRFRRMQVAGKYVMVVPERGEVWFNYWDRDGYFSRGPEKFSTPEELAKILMAA